MVVRPSVCLRRLARGRRAAQVGFGRFLANPKVTTERLIEGWSAQTAVAVAGRHVLVPQDTSEFNFSTTPKRRRGLGKIGKGGGRGVLLHAALALDRTENKESHRWITTAEQAKRGDLIVAGGGFAAGGAAGLHELHGGERGLGGDGGELDEPLGAASGGRP
jgi:hypothetical protein